MSDHDLDAIRAAMAEAMHANDCACGASMDGDHHTPDVPEWYTELADAALRAVSPTLDQLRANQLPDGGQWQYGVTYTKCGRTWNEWPTASTWTPEYAEILTKRWPATTGVVIRRRVAIGPIEPVSDSAASNSPDPDSDTQTTP